VREQLAYLRAALEQIQQELIEAEAGLADRLAEVKAFEFEFEARVGHLIDKLQALEEEIQRYHERIEIVRNRQIFGNPYLSVEAQYRRAWQAPPVSTPPPQPVGPADEAQIKKLYRQLARRCHPDLALNEADRARRTRIMAAINDAYAARSLAELIALVREVDRAELAGQAPPDWTEAQLVQALETELAQCRRRVGEIKEEIRHLSQRPSVHLSLEVKLARRRGHDLLAEMAAELEQKISRRTVERDMLKAQFDQLGPGQGFIDVQ
jgi:chromosome segregation ATPase